MATLTGLSSGNFAMLTAIRRASSLVNTLAEDHLRPDAKIIVLDRGIAPAGVPLERGAIEHRDPPAAVTQNATVLQLLGK
jgi:hypothetical protein